MGAARDALEWTLRESSPAFNKMAAGMVQMLHKEAQEQAGAE